MIKPEGYITTDDGAIGNAYIQPIYTTSEEGFWESVKQGYPTYIGKSGVSTTLTQAILDENGWTRGFDFANNATLSIPQGISGGSQKIYLWVINNVVYRGWDADRASRINAVNYFNKLWFDNTGTGLVSTDIPAAINELAGKVPDMTSYYTKDEVDTAISEAGGGGSDVSLNMPNNFTDGILVKGTQADTAALTDAMAPEKTATTETEFYEFLSAGYITKWSGSDAISITQETLDTYGWEAGWDFRLNTAMSFPVTVNVGLTAVSFVVGNKLYTNHYYQNANKQKNLIYQFNRIWYDNSTSGLTATDIPAAINELAASIPEAVDLTNYYTKEETEAFVNEVINNFAVAEEGTY